MNISVRQLIAIMLCALVFLLTDKGLTFQHSRHMPMRDRLSQTTVVGEKVNPTVYPYGGERDGSRRTFSTDLDPVNFKETAQFKNAWFADVPTFWAAKFDGDAVFTHSTFLKGGMFFSTAFNKAADFGSSTFVGPTFFISSVFRETANFSRVVFDTLAMFDRARFDGEAAFLQGQSCEFISFDEAVFNDEVHIGSYWELKVDLSLAVLSTRSKVVLCDVVELRLPVHKFKKLDLLEELSYTKKQSIIESLKHRSFPNDREAAFELDYLLARSTKYQAMSDLYIEGDIWQRAGDWLYDATLGFGYRPFRIIWWAVGIMLAGTVFYFLRMGDRINQYVVSNYGQLGSRLSSARKSTRGSIFGQKATPKREKGLGVFEGLLNCAYFSVMLFLTIRLKGDLLTFFNAKEKKWIIAEWLFGILIYLAFLYHTSSVLQNIRSLFVGG